MHGTLHMFVIHTLVAMIAVIASPHVEAQDKGKAKQPEAKQDQKAKAAGEEKKSGKSKQAEKQKQQEKQARAGEKGQVKFDPEGWIRIGTDYDHDGEFEAVRTIYYFDLERAFEMSDKRRAKEKEKEKEKEKAGEEVAAKAGKPAKDKGKEPKALHRISGKLESVKPIKVPGKSDLHLIAQIKGEKGRSANVLIGPGSAASLKEPQKINKVTVTSYPGLVGDVPMLIADKLQVDRKKSEDASKEAAKDGQKDAAKDRAKAGEKDKPKDSVTYDGRERAALGLLLGESEDGIRVAAVLRGGPAATAGIEPGDLLVSIADTKAESYRKVVKAVQQHKPGEKISIEVKRDGEKQNMEVKLVDRKTLYENRDR